MEILYIVLSNSVWCCLPEAACVDWLDFQVAKDCFLLGSSADLQRSLACTTLPRIASLATLPQDVYHKIILKPFDFFAVLLVGTTEFLGSVPWLSLACTELPLLLVPVSRFNGSTGFSTGDDRAIQASLALSSPAQAALIWSNTDHQAKPLQEFMFPGACRQDVPQALCLACGASTIVCLWSYVGIRVAGL